MENNVLYTKQRVPAAPDVAAERLSVLQKRLLRFSLVNFIIVACLGLTLRAFPLLASFPLEYKNLLHGHSHFAFGGWVMPALLVLILQFFPSICSRIPYRHWRNISVLTLVAAYGMLASFPVQGYQAVSISFSTLSITAGTYLSVMVWKALKQLPRTVAHRFLSAGLFYFVLSSAGPFATGPLIAMGKAGSYLYFDAIYFYLHFQYNGWFVLTLLAVFYQMLGKGERNGQKVFRLFAWSCLPAYFLSVLWSRPPAVFYWMGGWAALIQVAGLYFLWQDGKGFSWARREAAPLFKVAAAAFLLKNVLQLFSALPFAASMAYHFRNFVIAYLHLVLLGFISLFILAALVHSGRLVVGKMFQTGLGLFLFSFCTTELVLVLQALGAQFHFDVPGYVHLLFWLSIAFPLGLLLVAAGGRTGVSEPAIDRIG